MAPRPKWEVENGLKRKGFRLQKRGERFLHLYADGKKTRIHTHASHGASEISDGLLGKMARQIHLTRKQLDQLVDCPLSEERYIELLLSKGISL